MKVHVKNKRKEAKDLSSKINFEALIDQLVQYMKTGSYVRFEL